MELLFKIGTCPVLYRLFRDHYRNQPEGDQDYRAPHVVSEAWTGGCRNGSCELACEYGRFNLTRSFPLCMT